jgi:hypothetical protein
MAIKANKWLLDNGHITEITRGRMRLENIALLNQAVAEGVEFSDFPKGKVEVLLEATHDAPAVLTYKREDGYASNGEIAEIAPYLYNHDTHAAYEVVSGQKRSLREVCANDGVSLVQCTCGAPKVVSTNGLGHVAVRIVAENSKPYAGNVWDKKRK